MLLGYLNVFRMIISYFLLIIKGCFLFLFWSSGFELVYCVFGYVFE